MGEGTRAGALADRAWPEVGRPLVLVPLGSTEQHGPHLPLDTDTVIAVAVARAVAARLRGGGEGVGERAGGGVGGRVGGGVGGAGRSAGSPGSGSSDGGGTDGGGAEDGGADDGGADDGGRGAGGAGMGGFGGGGSGGDGTGAGSDGVLDAVVAPALPVGASGEHAGFPGTVSIGTEALARVVLELARSVSAWASRILIVNGHGGNVEALGRVAAELAREDRRCAWLSCTVPVAHDDGSPPDAHAGRTETSLLLHLDPARVRMGEVAPGATAPMRELLPAMRRGGVRAVSSRGVLGDPRGASAAEGARLFAAMVDDAAARVARWRAGDHGRLA